MHALSWVLVHLLVWFSRCHRHLDREQTTLFKAMGTTLLLPRVHKKREEFSLFSADWCWQRWRNWYSTITASIAKRKLHTLVLMYPCSYVLSMRVRVCMSWSFCYGCCHGRIPSVSSLPTSVCTKKKNNKKTLTCIIERCAQHLTLYFDEHVHAKCRPSGKCQSKSLRSSFWSEQACRCSVVRA